MPALDLVIPGVRAVRTRLGEFDGRVSHRRANKFLRQGVETAILRHTPVDTGRLRRSGLANIRVLPDRVLVKFSTDYADQVIYSRGKGGRPRVPGARFYPAEYADRIRRAVVQLWRDTSRVSQIREDTPGSGTFRRGSGVRVATTAFRSQDRTPSRRDAPRIRGR